MTFVHNEWTVQVVTAISQFPFVPIIDGYFLSYDPQKNVNELNFKKTDILLGSNAQEGSWFLVYHDQDRFPINNVSLITNEDYAILMDEMFFHLPQFPQQMNNFGLDAVRFHYKDWANPNSMESNRDRIALAVGDYHFVCPVNNFSDAYAKSGQKVYQYWFDHHSTVNQWHEWMGTLHADEIMFVFGLPLLEENGYSKEEQELSRRMMRYWTNCRQPIHRLIHKKKRS